MAQAGQLKSRHITHAHFTAIAHRATQSRISIDILAQAAARLSAAEAEVARLRAFIDVYHELNGVAPASPVAVRTRASNAAATISPSGVVVESAAAAIEYIKRVARPAPTRELLSVMAEQGIAVGGRDEVATLSARLSRSPLLKNIRGVGWETIDVGGGGTVGDLLGSVPTAPGPTPNSADEDDREVEHENTDLIG